MKHLFKSISILFVVTCLAGCADTSPITDLKVETSGHFTAEQLNYLASQDYSETSPYNGNMSKSIPSPVRFDWKGGQGQYRFSFSNDYNNQEVEYETHQETKDHLYDFYNPILGANYTVKVKYRGYEEQIVTFKESVTVPGPRNIRVEGVENFRDIGGWGNFVNNEYQTYIKLLFLIGVLRK